MEKLFWSRRDEKILISIFVFCHRLISRRNFSFLLVEGNDIQSDFLYPLTSKYLILISLAVSFFITLFLVGNGIMKKVPSKLI